MIHLTLPRSNKSPGNKFFIKTVPPPKTVICSLGPIHPPSSDGEYVSADCNDCLTTTAAAAEVTAL